MDKIKLITKRHRANSYITINHDYELEFLIDIEINIHKNKAGRIAVSYFDIKFVEYSKFEDEVEQIAIHLWDKEISIHGYGLSTVYEALINKKLKSVNLAAKDDLSADARVTSAFYVTTSGGSYKAEEPPATDVGEDLSSQYFI